MKPSDILILNEIHEINRRLAAQQVENTNRFDAIDEQLEEILKEVKRQPIENRYVSPELEAEIREASLRAVHIDRKVSDL